VRRIQRPEGQLLLSFDLVVEDVQPVVKIPSPFEEPPIEEAVEAEGLWKPPAVVVFNKPQPAKQRKKNLWKHDGPSVTLHKKGRYLLIKANDPIAAMYWADIKDRMACIEMRDPAYYGGPHNNGPYITDEDKTGKLRLWKFLGQELTDHPFCRILATYGVHVFVSPSLQNWMHKEHKRQTRWATPFPAPPVSSDVPLFARCCEGTILRCIKNFKPKGADSTIFEKDKRYMVVSTGGEGKDVIVLCTEAVEKGAKLGMVGNGLTREWTSFDPALETWFDDSEETEIGTTIDVAYPELTARMQAELKATGIESKLYEHVQKDVVLGALKNGLLNAYPMRMAKTSFAIAHAKLVKNSPVAFIGPRNARIFTVKELNRLGYKENQDYVIVDSFADLEKPAWMYLLTYSWLKGWKDPGKQKKLAWDNYLKPSIHSVKRRTGKGKDDFEVVDVPLFNKCPHCQQDLQRLRRLGTPDQPPEGAMRFREPSKLGDGQMTDVWYIWTPHRGYRCINQECVWLTDNRKKKGAGWISYESPHAHKGGYVDWGLAAHASCKDSQVKTRKCSECGETEGFWRPMRARRLTKRFNLGIVDEIHNCKAPSSDTAQAVFKLKPKRRLGLTGTPISNNPKDVYWLLHWLVGAPNMQMGYFRNEGLKEFDERFCDKLTLEKPLGEEVNADTGEVTQITKLVKKDVPFLKNPPDFWRFMLPNIIRRNYTDPLFLKALKDNNKFMPQVEVIKMSCPMDPHQAQIMLDSIKDFKTQYEKMLAEAEKQGGILNSALVISQMSNLRKVATIPDVLNQQFGAEVYKGVRGGGKMEHIARLVTNEVNRGKKILILSDFKAMHEAVREELKHYHPILFNTNWDDEAREDAFDSFQNGDANVFIAGTRAVREGVDLSAADTCICTDLLWAPAMQTQAWSRIMAPGSKERTCRVYLTVSAHSLDEHIYTVFYSKMVAASQALDRKAIDRRAQEFDVKWFVERVLDEESAIQSFLIDAGANSLIVGGQDGDDGMEVREA
jgi:hypothetical protein